MKQTEITKTFITEKSEIAERIAAEIMAIIKKEAIEIAHFTNSEQTEKT